MLGPRQTFQNLAVSDSFVLTSMALNMYQFRRNTRYGWLARPYPTRTFTFKKRQALLGVLTHLPKTNFSGSHGWRGFCPSNVYPNASKKWHISAMLYVRFAELRRSEFISVNPSGCHAFCQRKKRDNRESRKSWAQRQRSRFGCC